MLKEFLTPNNESKPHKKFLPDEHIEIKSDPRTRSATGSIDELKSPPII